MAGWLRAVASIDGVRLRILRVYLLVDLGTLTTARPFLRAENAVE
jgi:hypothetical protein